MHVSSMNAHILFSQKNKTKKNCKFVVSYPDDVQFYSACDLVCKPQNLSQSKILPPRASPVTAAIYADDQSWNGQRINV